MLFLYPRAKTNKKTQMKLDPVFPQAETCSSLISRLKSTEGICAGLHREGFLLSFSSELALVEMCLEGTVGGTSCLYSSLCHLVVLFSSLSSNVSNGLMVKMASPISLAPPVGSSSPHRCVISHSSIVPSSSQLPTFSLSELKVACQVAPPSWVLSQELLCFKTPHFRDPYSWDPL